MRLFVALLVLVAVAVACECVGSPRQSATADALFAFEKDHTAGFLNARGKVQIRPKLDVSAVSYNIFDSGRLLLENHETVVYLDMRGREAIHRTDLARANEFQDGLAAVLTKDGRRWGFLAPDGSFAIEPQFAEAHDTDIGFFSEGLAAIQLGGKTGYIDKSGKWAIDRQFAKAYEFHEGFAAVIAEGPCNYYPAERCCVFLGSVPYTPSPLSRKAPPCAFSLIDRTGRRTTEKTFAYLQRVSEGLAGFRDGEKWGFIDTNGEIVIPATFDDVKPFSEGRALVYIGENCGFVDREGTLVIPARYPWAGSFANGLAPVEDVSGAGWHGYIDRNGKVAIREEFGETEEFHNGLARVQLLPKDHKFGEAEVSIVPYDEYYRYAYIDPTGRHVFEYSR